MKLLKIENDLGYYLDEENKFSKIDKINKEDLLRLVDYTLTEEVEFDEYSDTLIKHQAHQILYKSISEKLLGLQDRKEEFQDESERLFLDEYERYREESTSQDICEG